jgi:hypothetical protein
VRRKNTTGLAAAISTSGRHRVSDRVTACLIVAAVQPLVYRMIAAYRHPDPAAGRELMVKLIESLSARPQAAGRDRQARPHPEQASR